MKRFQSWTIMDYYELSLKLQLYLTVDRDWRYGLVWYGFVDIVWYGGGGTPRSNQLLQL